MTTPPVPGTGLRYGRPAELEQILHEIDDDDVDFRRLAPVRRAASLLPRAYRRRFEMTDRQRRLRSMPARRRPRRGQGPARASTRRRRRRLRRPAGGHVPVVGAAASRRPSSRPGASLRHQRAVEGHPVPSTKPVALDPHLSDLAGGPSGHVDAEGAPDPVAAQVGRHAGPPLTALADVGLHLQHHGAGPAGHDDDVPLAPALEQLDVGPPLAVGEAGGVGRQAVHGLAATAARDGRRGQRDGDEGTHDDGPASSGGHDTAR